jgi:hypothetical protein
MAKNSEFDQYFMEDTHPSTPVSANIEAAPLDPYPQKIPNPLDPMGQIGVEGIAYRSLAGGGMPWWILGIGWIFFGSMAFFWLMGVFSTIVVGGLAALPGSLMPLIPGILVISLPLWILGRGTQSKLRQRHKNRSC